MGAEVIKIEPAEGETMRTRPPVRNHCSSVFGQLNAGKKSLVLDLKSRKAVDVIRKLAASADILVENFRPGVMRRLKLDYASLRQVNPKLVYCSISGYGQTGPSAELPAYAPVIHAASGYDMAHLSTNQAETRPDYCGIYHADIVTGVYAFGAISAALYQRQESQPASTSTSRCWNSMLSLTLNEVQWSQFDVTVPSRPLFGPVETADGYVMIAIASEKTFQNLVTAAGHPEWIGDPRFARYADRRKNWAGLMDGIETWSRTLWTAQCLAVLNDNGVPSSAYRTVAQALSDPQIAAPWRIGRGAGRRRHLQGNEFAVPDVGRRGLGRSARGYLGEHTLTISRRPAFRTTKSRPSAANRRWPANAANAFVSTALTWQCRTKSKNIGREAMKSFQVAEFNAPLERGRSADPAAIGYPGPDQGESGGRLPQRPAHLGRRL